MASPCGSAGRGRGRIVIVVNWRQEPAMYAGTLVHETTNATAEPSELTVAFEDAHAAALGIVGADAQARL